MLKPRVALISHTYLEKQYRGKLPIIGQFADLTVISPNQYPWAYGMRIADFADEQGYNLRLYPGHFPIAVQTSTRFVLASRDFGFRYPPSPDIIHVENEESSFLLVQALLFRRQYAPKAKIIVFVWANLPLRGFNGFLQKMIVKWARPQIDFYIAGNSEGKHLLIQDGILTDRVVVLPQSGVDTEYFKPVSSDERIRLRSKLGMQPNQLVIGFVGRFCEEKGLFDLLEVVRQLRSSGDQQICLLCVGDGPLRSILEAQYPDVIVVSPGGDGKVMPYYQIMDILVLPSHTTEYWKEQFGRVLIEAMACGVPVVGSSSGAIPEVVANAGLIFIEGDLNALMTNLQKMITAPDLRHALGETGRRRVIDNYSHINIAQKTCQIYQQLLPMEDVS